MAAPSPRGSSTRSPKRRLLVVLLVVVFFTDVFGEGLEVVTPNVAESATRLNVNKKEIPAVRRFAGERFGSLRRRRVHRASNVETTVCQQSGGCVHELLSARH